MKQKNKDDYFFLFSGLAAPLAATLIVAALSEVTGGKGVIRAGKGSLGAYQDFWCHFFL